MKTSIIYSALFILLFACYDSSYAQSWQWAKKSVSHNYSSAQNVVTDSRGNYYNCGYTYDNSISFGAITLNSPGPFGYVVKYDSLGNPLWARGSQSIGGGVCDVSFSEIAIDNLDGIYIVGYYEGSKIVFGHDTMPPTGSFDHMMLLKYDTAGNEIWAKTSSSSASQSGMISGFRVRVDSYGNLNCAGYFTVTSISLGSPAVTLTGPGGGNSTFFTAKFNSSGTLMRAHTWLTSPTDIHDMVAGPNGSMILSGIFSGYNVTIGTTTLPFRGNEELYITKLDSSGAAVWAKTIGGSLNEFNPNLVVDNNGDIYVGGESSSPAVIAGNDTITLPQTNYNQSFLAKFDANGNTVWATSITSPIQADVIGITVDPSGNPIISGRYKGPLYLNGTTLNNAGAFDLFIAKYFSCGTMMWAKKIGGTGSEYCGVSYDHSAHILVSGNTGSDTLVVGNTTLYRSPNTTSNYMIAKLNDTTLANIPIINTHSAAQMVGSICPGLSFNVPFDHCGTFNAGNIWTAQLSDSSGSFASPVIIGSSSVTNATYVPVSIPTHSTGGTHFRIRVVASNPVTIGSNNGTDFGIYTLPVITLSSTGTCTVIDTLLVNGADNQPGIVWKNGNNTVDSIVFGNGPFIAVVAGDSLGTTGTDAYHFYLPESMFFDSHGNLFVVDLFNQRIQEFTPGSRTGITVAGGNGNGNGPDQLSDPNLVFVDGADNIYVMDAGNCRVQKFIPGSTVGVTVAGGTCGTASNQINYPGGMWVDALGNVYLAESVPNRISKWASGASTGVTVIGGSAGSGANQLNGPTDVIFDANGNMYVSDVNNNRVQKYPPGSTNGVTVAGGNGSGSAANQLNNPSRIQLDQYNNLYIYDAGNSRIQKWANGATTGITMTKNFSALDFYIDSLQNIYSCNSNYNNVTEFRPGNYSNNTYLTSSAGVYSAIITTASGGCKDTSNTIIIGSGVAPTINITAVPAGSICQGTSVTYTANITNGGTSPTYQWTINGVVAGTGATFTTSSLQNNDTVKVKLTSSAACAVPATVTASTRVSTTVQTATSTATICAGGTLNGHAATGTYIDTIHHAGSCDSIITTQLTVLPKDSVANVVTVCNGQSYLGHSASGTFNSIYTNHNGCDSIISLQLTVLAPDTDNNIISICQGDSYNGHTASGTYVDSFTNVHGCDSTRTLVLTVNALPPVPTITQNGDTLISSTATSYQWYSVATAITNATGNNVAITQNGPYSVHVTDANGCTNISAVFNAIGVGIAETSNNTVINIYPNPTTGMINIACTGLQNGEPLEIKAVNSLGQTVISKTYTQVQPDLSVQLDMSQFAQGIYLLQINQNGHTDSRHIMLVR